MTRKRPRARGSRRNTWYLLSLRLFVTVGVLALGMIAVTQLLDTPTPSISRVKVGGNVGQQAPDFALNNLQGEAVKLSQFRGQPVVLTFMRPTCRPCHTSATEFQAAYAAYKEQGLVVLAVNQGDSQTEIRQFVEQHQLDYPVVLDPDSATGELYNLLNTPTTYFVGPEGIIRDMVLGVVYRPWIETNLATLKE